MDRSMMTGLVLGGLAVVSLGAFAAYQAREVSDSYARVLSVERVMKDVRTPQQHYGYDVRYKTRDGVGLVHMDHDPGPFIPLQDGKLVLGSVPPSGRG